MAKKGVPRPRWTGQEDDAIREHYPDAAACAAALEGLGTTRNRDAIMRRAQALGLARKGTTDVWGRTEKAILTEYYPDGGPTEVKERLAELGYERTEAAITSRAKILGVRRIDRGVEGKWTDAEVEIIRKAYQTCSISQIREELAKHGYDRSESAINARIHILGLKRKPVRRKEKAGDSKIINFVLDTVLDGQIIDRLAATRNRSEYIRRLIKKDIESEKK